MAAVAVEAVVAVAVVRAGARAHHGAKPSRLSHQLGVDLLGEREAAGQGERGQVGHREAALLLWRACRRMREEQSTGWREAGKWRRGGRRERPKGGERVADARAGHAGAPWGRRVSVLTVVHAEASHLLELRLAINNILELFGRRALLPRAKLLQLGVHALARLGTRAHHFCSVESAALDAAEDGKIAVELQPPLGVRQEGH